MYAEAQNRINAQTMGCQDAFTGAKADSSHVELGFEKDYMHGYNHEMELQTEIVYKHNMPVRVRIS